MARAPHEECLEHDQHAFNHTMAEVAAQLVTLRADNQDKIIASALQKLGTMLGVDRGYVFSFSDNLARMSNTHEWCDEGIEPQIERIQNVPTDAMPWWKERITQNKPVLIPAVSDLPPEAQAEREEFSSQGIQSLVCLPLIDEGGHLIGFMGFDAVRKPRSWLEQEIDVLSLTAHLLATAMGRSRVQLELEESEALLDATGSIARTGGWQLDVETLTVTWTRETYRIHEVPQHEKPPLHKAIEFFHPDDRDALSWAIQRAIHLGEPYDMEVRLITAKGRNLWTRTVCQPEVVDGQTVRLRGMLQDVTERKQAEDALRESNRRLEAFLEVSQGITAYVEIGSLMQMIVDNASRVMNIDSGAIYLLTSENTIHLEATTPPLPSNFPEEYRAANLTDHPHIGKAIRTGRYCLMPDSSTANLTLAEQEVVRLRNLRSNLYLPIRLKGESIGILILSSTKRLHTFGEEDIYFLQGFADHAAQMISNVRNYEIINKHAAELEKHIAAQKRVEEAIRENAELLAHSQQIAHLGSWKLDVSAKRLHWSDEVYRIFGCAPQEFEATYEAFLSFVHPDDRAAVDKAYTRSVREKHGGYEIEHRIIRKDTGEERFVHEQCIHEFDDAGAVIRSIGMVHDITERKQAEELNRKSAERAKGQSSLIAQLTFDDSIVNSPVDDALKVITTKVAATLQVDRVSVWLLSEDNTKLERLMLYDAASGHHSQVDTLDTAGIPSYFEALRKDSQIDAGDAQKDKRTKELVDRYLVPLKISSLLDSAIQRNGRLLGVLSAEHRGPIRKWFADEQSFVSAIASLVAQLFANAERRRSEAEREKLQAQLFQAQKMEVVGRLAGGVAHDFNNMLTVILGGADMAMEEAGGNDKLRNSLYEIQKAAMRSAGLTRQLLAYARRQTVAPKVLDINEAIEGMLKMLRRLIGEDMDLIWRPGSNLYPVFIDPAQFDQILVNLCVNARDAIAGAGKITVETDNVSFDEAHCVRHPDFVPGEFVMLAVSDNGCGMDTEILGQLFEPFFTTKAAGKGTGLGLATVYGMVKQNKGFISVYSEPGQGTTFEIFLPRHAARTAPKTEQKQAAPPAANCEVILLVEDESAILKMTTLLLEGLGYTVIAASTPGEAIRLARECEGQIDLLITDVIMPEMNGRDLARNLMSIFPGIKRLFMSGYTANVIARHGVLDAGVHFIQKPFSRNALAAKIREALDRE